MVSANHVHVNRARKSGKERCREYTGTKKESKPAKFSLFQSLQFIVYVVCRRLPFMAEAKEQVRGGLWHKVRNWTVYMSMWLVFIPMGWSEVTSRGVHRP